MSTGKVNYSVSIKLLPGDSYFSCIFFRDKILDALVEIKENKGSLSGLALTSIVQMTSSLLKKKYASKLEEKPVTGTHLRNK